MKLTVHHLDEQQQYMHNKQHFHFREKKFKNSEINSLNIVMANSGLVKHMTYTQKGDQNLFGIYKIQTLRFFFSTQCIFLFFQILTAVDLTHTRVSPFVVDIEDVDDFAVFLRLTKPRLIFCIVVLGCHRNIIPGCTMYFAGSVLWG